MRMPRTRRQAGDTIVEVLICIGIVGLVLTGAFVVAQKSTNAVQDSNEHGKAGLYLQSQVEMLKQYLGNGGAVKPDTAKKYCMTTADQPPLDVTVAAGQCTKTDGGANYDLSFQRTGDIYNFEVSWDSVRGGVSRASYVYRVYPAP